MTTLSSHSSCGKCKDGYIIETIDGYENFIECECHIKERINRYLKNSGIDTEEYQEKTLDSFTEKDESSKAMKALALKFLADKTATGIGFFGKSGTGKTHICIAICQGLTNQRTLPHKYFSYRREIQKLKALAFNEQEYSRLIEKWSECKVLYIDDLFKFAVDKAGSIQTQDLQIMYDIINTRYLNKAMTIFSSEYTVNDIKKIDEALASRIYSMITPYGIVCDGKNRRFT